MRVNERKDENEEMDAASLGRQDAYKSEASVSGDKDDQVTANTDGVENVREAVEAPHATPAGDDATKPEATQEESATPMESEPIVEHPAEMAEIVEISV